MRKLIVLLTLIFTISIYADDLAAAKSVKEMPKGTGLKKDGIVPFLGVSSSFTLTNNKSVIGQNEGTTMVFGVSLDGSLDILKGNNEIGIVMSLNEQFSKTPLIDRFIKNGDLFKLSAVYLYHISDVWGPFFSFLMQTSILDGYDERAEDITYNYDATTKTDDRFKLTSSFAPITFKEVLGAYYKPITKDEITFEARGGLGATHVLADDNYYLDSYDKDTKTAKLGNLESYNQLGASLFLKAKGGINLLTKLTYETYLDVLVPFVYEAKNDENAFEYANLEYSLTVTSKIFSIIGVKYQLKVVRQPQLLDEWQVQNNLFLDLSYVLVGKKK